jgi:hypothetical protein
VGEFEVATGGGFWVAAGARGEANFPGWARSDVDAFWKEADKYERSNGNTYREYEVALPRELSRAEQIALVKNCAEGEFGMTRPYLWVIHAPIGPDGEERPQARLMFSDRQIDGIERAPALCFKRANLKAPQTGGAKKLSYGTPLQARAVYTAIRERWAKVQNLALERAGVDTRVDHRSLAAQGIVTRERGIHRGRAINAIERRGDTSEVGEIKRREWQGRAEKRAETLTALGRLEMAEAALHITAAQESRELLAELSKDPES